MREEYINPPSPDEEEGKIKSHILLVCLDILRHGERTQYQEEYDSLYEIVEGKIEEHKGDWRE